MKDAFKRCGNQKVGVGGYTCSCCGPKASKRKQFRRTTRRRLKQQTKKEVAYD